MVQKRASKEQLIKLAEAIANHAGNWQHGDNSKFARLYGVDMGTVARVKKRCGIQPTNYKTVKAMIERNPNLTFEEVVKISGMSPKTIERLNREYQLGLKALPISRNVTQQAVEGLTFYEVVKKFGISDSYLCHLIKRKGLKIVSKKGNVCNLTQEN